MPRCLRRKFQIGPHDQEIKVRQISVVLKKEKSENGKASEFGNIQDKGRGPETRASSAVL